MASKTVDEVRKALEELKLRGEKRVDGLTELEDALVTEGLKVCDVLASLQPDETLEYQAQAKLDLIVAILRSAGRIA